MPAAVTDTIASTGAPVTAICPTCCNDSQRRIAELEAQIKILTDKASAAADRLADREDELRQLKDFHGRAITRDPNLTSDGASLKPNGATSPTTEPARNRFSSLLGSRKILPQPLPSQTTVATAPRDSDLQTALSREQQLRQQLEDQLAQMSAEMEELSGTLFQQANEMVATERRARAKLEERLKELEGKEKERGNRLERLEGAVARIERVKNLLGP